MDNVFGVLFGLCHAFYISVFMTLIMLCSVPISTMLSRFFSNYYKEMAKQKQDILAQSTNVALESIENIKTIKSFSNESKQELLFATEISKTYDFAVNIAFSKAIFEGIVTVLTFMSVACVIWYGSNLYLDGGITSGDMVSFLIIRYFGILSRSAR